MSVRKGDRGEGTLQVLNDCRILASYTIQICRNEKVFPKSQRWIMSQRIVNECVDAMTCIRRANSVMVYTSEDFKYRRVQQVEAHAHLDALLSLIDLAFTSFDIEARKIEYWTGLALSTDDKLKSWMKADKQRYKNIITDESV